MVGETDYHDTKNTKGTKGGRLRGEIRSRITITMKA